MNSDDREFWVATSSFCERVLRSQNSPWEAQYGALAASVLLLEKAWNFGSPTTTTFRVTDTTVVAVETHSRKLCPQKHPALNPSLSHIVSRSYTLYKPIPGARREREDKEREQFFSHNQYGSEDSTLPPTDVVEYANFLLKVVSRNLTSIEVRIRYCPFLYSSLPVHLQLLNIFCGLYSKLCFFSLV